MIDATAPGERRAHILKRIQREGRVSLADLASEHAVSAVTVHRDLQLLSEEGLLQRVRGGARSLPDPPAQIETGWNARLREAAPEKEEVKRAIFRALIPHLKPSCILASNTSSISITRLAASTDRPEKFIGMHFMNPVPVMKLIEVIRGIATAEPTFQAVQALAARLDKTTAVSEDFPAFIVNRILVPMINEAVYALYEGVGGVTAIDSALRLGANHKMGPLELADFIGLDTCLSIMQVLHEGLADSKYRPCPLLVKYVEAGWLGRKTGRGFYDYTTTPPRPTR